MNESEKAQIYVELFKTHIDRFNRTRDIQWKLNISLWTLIAASCAFGYGKYIPSLREAGVILVAVTIGYFFAVAKLIQDSLESEKKIFLKYRAEIEKIANGETLVTVDDTGSANGKKWIFYTTAMTSLLLSLALWILHSAKS